MSQRFFLKELVSRPVTDRTGKRVPFETFGGDYGGIVLDSETEKDLIQDLEKMADEHVGGILRSSEAEFISKKNLPKHQPHDPRSEIRVYNPSVPKPQDPAAGAAGAETPISPLQALPRGLQPASQQQQTGEPPANSQEPPKVPLPNFKPRTGRPGGKKAADAPAAPSPAA